MLPLHYTKFSVFNYDEIPPGYYYLAMRNGSGPQRFWHETKFREVANRIRNGSKVLDFGCGPGSFLAVLTECHDRCEAIGVDIASRQIDFARKEIGAHSPRVRFDLLEEEWERLPFADASFDFVTSIEVIEHIHPFLAMRVLHEMRRVLKPEGRLLLTTPNYRSFWPVIEAGLEVFSKVKYHGQHINKFTPNALVKFLETAGFELDSLRSLFLAAPFTAGLSWPLAERLHRLEKTTPHRMGSLLLAEARPSFFPRA